MNITQTDSGDKYHNGESSTIKIRSPMKESQNMFNLPSPITHPDQYKQNLSNLVRRFSLPIVAIGAVFVFWILSQLLTTILLGAATLVAAVASIAIGWLSVMMAKPFSLWIANKRMSLMLAEARKRPIETREYVSRYNRQRLVEQSNELDNYVAEVNAFENEVRKMRTSNPQRVGPFAERLVELRESVSELQKMLAEARVEADNYDAATEEARQFWKLSAMSDRMNRLTQESATDIENRRLAIEAMETTELAMQRVFARIENNAKTRRREAPTILPQLENSPSPELQQTIIDLNRVEEKVRK
jgi:hypothetical protein